MVLLITRNLFGSQLVECFITCDKHSCPVEKLSLTGLKLLRADNYEGVKMCSVKACGWCEDVIFLPNGQPNFHKSVSCKWKLQVINHKWACHGLLPIIDVLASAHDWQILRFFMWMNEYSSTVSDGWCGDEINKWLLFHSVIVYDTTKSRFMKFNINKWISRRCWKLCLERLRVSVKHKQQRINCCKVLFSVHDDSNEMFLFE